MRARLLVISALAGCHPPPTVTPKAPPTVVTEAVTEHVAPFERLPPPMLPVDCVEASRAGVVGFCDQQVSTSATHVACHERGQVSTAALACLPELRSITLRDTRVMRLEPLRELKNLRRLNLSRTNVVDLAPLARLSSLRELALDETRVVDLTPIAKLPALSKLRLRKMHIVDWTTLAGFPALVELDVTDNARPDVTGLGLHANLQVAEVPDSLADYGPFASMPKLRKLVVRHAWSSFVSTSERQKAFEGLAGLTQLRELEVYRSEVTSLAPLARMSNLQELWLDAPEATSLAPLTKLTNLTFLGLAATEVLGDRIQAELASLASLPKLVNLTVYESPSDTSYLRGFSRLEGLLLSSRGSETLDIGGVAGLPKLELFEVRWGKVERLSPLIRVKSLTGVTLDATKVPLAEVEALRRARPSVSVSYAPEPEDDAGDIDDSDDPEDW